MTLRTTTLSMMTNGRICNAGDFLALGEDCHKIPDWRHLAVTWSYKDYSYFRVQSADNAGDLYRNLTAHELASVEKHIRAYDNLHTLEPTQ